MPKITYKIKVISGDYYYEKMSIEEAMEKMIVPSAPTDKLLRSQADIDEYIRDNMSQPMPKDGPLIRMYF